MLEIIILVCILIYIIRTIVFLIGSEIENHNNILKKENTDFPYITVVVPCRNEEANVERCFTALSESDYPADRFEILAVNDRSGDSTESKLNALAQNIPNMKVINIKDYSQKGNLKGKPGALHAGILQAKGDLIFMTDADCSVNKNWIQSLSLHHSKTETGLTASYTLIKYKSIFDKIQAIEWIYMHTMAMAGIGLNQPLGCYGNNLTVKRDDYFKIGGYPNIKFSVTEDLALLNAIVNTGKNARYICDYNTTVTTLPCADLSEYIGQHRRWAVGGIDLGWRAVLFVITSISVWVGIFLSLFSSSFGLFALILAIRILADSILILKPIVRLKSSKLLPYVPQSVFFFLIMELIIPFLIINRKIVWKGQVFHK